VKCGCGAETSVVMVAKLRSICQGQEDLRMPTCKGCSEKTQEFFDQMVDEGFLDDEQDEVYLEIVFANDAPTPAPGEGGV